METKHQNHETAIIDEALAERHLLPFDERVDFSPPPIAKTKHIPALRWAFGCYWQDHPIAIVLSIIGGAVALIHTVIGAFK